MANKAKKAAKKLGGMAGNAAKSLSNRRSRLEQLEAEAMGKPRGKKKRTRPKGNGK